MSLIVPSVVVSVVLLSFTYALAKSRYGLGAVCWLTGVTTVLSVFLCSPALSLHSLGSFVMALVCAGCKLGPKAVSLASVAIMIGVYGMLLSMSAGELRERQQLRAEFPMESLADRLAYEEKAGQEASPAPVLDSNIEKRLSQFEDRGGSNFRSFMLSSLHSRTHDEFVMARGFGMVRMLRVKKERIELPETPPVALPTPDEPENYIPSAGERPVPLAAPRKMDLIRPPRTVLLTMHDAGLEDFFNTESMGYIEDRGHVAGFEPHRFRTVPQPRDKEPAATHWQVVRLELVSLLKHETPVAYASEFLPRMDKLKEAATRPLNSFERAAIDRLRTEEDLVIDETPKQIRMVGSLRAGKNCLECHSARRGDLLGAFSYELVPERPVHAPRDRGEPLRPQA